MVNDFVFIFGSTRENLRQMMQRHLGVDERTQVRLGCVRGIQPHALVSELGLYKLILRAQHPNTNPMFNFEGHDVRVVMIKDQPWFVAMDARDVLGITQGGTNFHYLSDDEIKVVQKSSGLTTLDLFYGRACKITLLSESGLYKFIMRSDKPVAKRFQDWLSREVLPALRKDGMYVMGEEKVKTGEMSEDELVLKAMTLLQGKVTRAALTPSIGRSYPSPNAGPAQNCAGSPQEAVGRLGGATGGLGTS